MTVQVSNLAMFVYLVLMLAVGQAFRFPSLVRKSQYSYTHTSTSLFSQICDYEEVSIESPNEGPPKQEIHVMDLTPKLNEMIRKRGVKNGVLTVISKHTTVAITINELESRLSRDIENYFLNLAPPDERSFSRKKREGVRYLHNDIDQRPEGEEEAERCRENEWDIDDPQVLEKWRQQEPINAHSHLLSMILGSSESIPIVDGRMVIGQWQSVLMVDLDGPRQRTVGVQIMGNC